MVKVWIAGGTGDIAGTVVYAIEGLYAPCTHICVMVHNVHSILLGEIVADHENKCGKEALRNGKTLSAGL